MIETAGLTHLHLRIGDLEASLRFYQEVFGMHEKFRDGRLVFLNTPGSGDSLTLNPEDGQVRHGGGIDHFGFRAEAGIIAER